ncbi:MAG: transglutaminase domain protein [Rhodospirillales bacterium]|nr:transglutaminase domain protein [Rhodospirillales bacterium]
MRYAVQHRSSFDYQDTIDLSYHVLHLTPRSLPWQRVIETRIRTTPGTPPIIDSVDYFGNGRSFLSLAEPHARFVVDMTARVEVTAREPVRAAATPPWESVRDALDRPELPADIEAAEFVAASPLIPGGAEFAAYAAPTFTPGRPILEAALDLTRRIHREFTFDTEATEVTTPLSEILVKRRGVCQDFAHTEVAALRAMGLAARYVSGYIRTYAAHGKARRVGADASHAWASVYCPGSGWIDLDPTNNMVVGQEHITLAWGRDYGDVSPVRGVILGSGDHRLAVSVDVEPLDD